jgi:DNA-binding IclR family transcriptional regulator
VFLAALSEMELDSLLAKTNLVANTANTITDPNVLKRHLHMVREHGYAVDDEETFEGVRCIAAPICDHKEQVIAAMGISGPATRVTVARLSELAQIVMTVAAQASAALGAPGISDQGNRIDSKHDRQI